MKIKKKFKKLTKFLTTVTVAFAISRNSKAIAADLSNQQLNNTIVNERTDVSSIENFDTESFGQVIETGSGIFLTTKSNAKLNSSDLYKNMVDSKETHYNVSHKNFNKRDRYITAAVLPGAEALQSPRPEHYRHTQGPPRVGRHRGPFVSPPVEVPPEVPGISYKPPGALKDYEYVHGENKCSGDQTEPGITLSDQESRQYRNYPSPFKDRNNNDAYPYDADDVRRVGFTNDRRRSHVYDRHAEALGMTENKNTETKAIMEQKIVDIVQSPDTKRYNGSYEYRTPAYHYVTDDNLVISVNATNYEPITMYIANPAQLIGLGRDGNVGTDRRPLHPNHQNTDEEPTMSMVLRLRGGPK